MAVALGGLWPAPATAQSLQAEDARIYRAAFEAVDGQRWDDALAIAATARDPLLAKVVRWQHLQRPLNGESFADFAAFVTANPHWPGMALLTMRAEEAMNDLTPAADLVDWFAVNPPRTGDGAWRYARALEQKGRADEIPAMLRAAWVDLGFPQWVIEEVLRRYGNLLRAEDHRLRTERLLWNGNPDAAERMLPLLSADARALAEARIRLQRRQPGVDQAIRRVPADLRDDPGLAFDRVVWRRHSNMDDGVRELLRSPPADLAYPALWWRERHLQIRRQLNEGAVRDAYVLAAGHGASEGAPFAEAEFLAGWIALRFLGQPQTALGHFTRLHDGVGLPISLARGAYWAGRAAEAAGDSALAGRWYREAAQHGTTFYGQLALERVGEALALPEEPAPSDAARAEFLGGELVRIVFALAEIGATDHARPFLQRLALDAGSAEEYLLVGDIALALDRHELAVFAGKRAVGDGHVLPTALYPTLPLPDAGAVEPAIILGLIRQESEFHREAISRAGARGLMQLMPATAEAVARQVNLPHSVARLTADPDYNITLGRTYLGSLIDRFRGSYILALAGYNAGPSRSNQWIAANGDPRDPAVDPVDWIELIPFAETRNYVQRVMESTQVYRMLLGADRVPTLYRDLRRGAPLGGG